MSLTVNQSLNAPANVASVFAGTEPRRAPVSDEKRAVAPQGQGVRASQQAINRLDNEQQSKQSSFQNANSSRGLQAVAAYQSQQNEQRRTEVQSLLGVDLYA
jgi:hypothetical protein